MQLFERIKRKIGILAITALIAGISTQTAIALQPDIKSDSDFWTRIAGNAILPINTSEELGTTSSRIAKIYATALDISSLIISGIALSGDIDSTGAAIDWDLYDNDSSALSYDAVGKTGILNIDTTDTAEGISTSGYFTATGTVTGGTLTDGTASITGGDISGVGTITATSLTDGTATLTAGDMSGLGSVTATSFVIGTDTLDTNEFANLDDIDQSLATSDNVQFAQATLGNTGLIVGASTPFSDSTGTLTLQAVDALDATTKSTIESAIDTLANLTSIGSATGVMYSTAGALSYKTIGIADDNIIETDDASIADNDFAKFTVNGIEGRTYAETKQDLSLDNVENTALSTWVGSANITTLGTIATGTWEGTAIAADQGGTGQASYTNGQLLIGNTTGNTLAKGTLTGTTNEIDITNGAGSIEIGVSSNYAGGSLIDTVGTVTTGTWNGDTIAIANGGTGNTTAQDAINALTQVSGATDEYVLTKDTTTGNAIWKEGGGGGGGTLQDAYDGGAGVTAVAGTPIALSGGTNLMTMESTATTETAMKITADSLTTGKGLWIYSNSADVSTRSLLTVEDAHGSATGSIGVWVKHYGNYDAQIISHFGSSGDGLEVNMSTVANTNGYGINIGSAANGGSFRIAHTAPALTTKGTMDVSYIANVTANKTGSMNTISSIRTAASATDISDDYDQFSITRSFVANNAAQNYSGTGSVLRVENSLTDTSSTSFADTTKGIEVVMPALGTGTGIDLTYNNVAGTGVSIVTAATTGTGMSMQGDSLTTGTLISLGSTIAGANTSSLLTISTNTVQGVKITTTSTSSSYGTGLSITTDEGTGLKVTGDNTTSVFRTTDPNNGDGNNQFTGNSLTTGILTKMSSTSTGMTSGKLFVLTHLSSGIIADKTGEMNTMTSSRTMLGATTRSDDYDQLLISRTSVSNGASSIFNSAGSVLKLENVATQTAGTLTDTVNVLELVQDADSTGDLIYSATFRVTGAGGIIAPATNDFSAGSFELPNSATLPATCLAGQMFYDTDSDDCADTGAGDGALCLCKSTDTWVLLNNV